MSERRDGDRIVVSGYSAGSHFPRTQAATQYRLELDGLSKEGAFHVDGAVYGRDLRLRGPGAVLGPILGRGDVALENHSGQVQRLMAGLHANGNVVARSRGAPLGSLLGRGLAGADYVIRGDVVAEHVSLENAVVFGNVRGRRVRLTACLVLGQVLATEEAVVSASTLFAYETPSIRFEGPCCALHALGSSDVPPSFADFTDGAGKRWPLQIVFYPSLFARSDGALMHRPEGQGVHEFAQLHAADWVRVDAIKLRRRVQGERVVEERVPVERYVLSIAGRALNFKEISSHIERLTWMLKTVLEFEHYHPNVRQRLQREWVERCKADERVLLELSLAPPAHPGSRGAAGAGAPPSPALTAIGPSAPSAGAARPAPASMPRPTQPAVASPASAPAATAAVRPSPPQKPVAPPASPIGADAPPPSAAEWMIKRPGGAVVGPASHAKVVQAITEGKIPLDCVLALKGSEDWRSIGEIPEFAAAASRVTPSK
jgi:hypothetical protein